MKENWYVLQFTSTRFQVVFSHLTNSGVKYFCPMSQSRFYRRPDKAIGYRKRITPLFPGYLFLSVNFSKIHTSKITAIPWAQRFISFGGAPVPVDETIIKELILKYGDNVFQGNTMQSQNVKSIPHRLAEILLEENPDKRSIMLLNYITDTFAESQKEISMIA